jgi:hypothetical protein
LVNAILGMDQGLVQRILNIEKQLRALSTQPILLNASTGQDGGKGLSTDLNGLHVYAANGNEVVRINTADGGLNAFGQVGNISINSGAISGNTVPTITFTTTDGGGVQSYSGQILQSYNELLLYGPQTTTNAQSQAIISAKDSGAWIKALNSAGAGAAYLNITNTGTFYLGNWAGTAGVYTTAQNGPILVTGGLTVSGTKNFVMDHPTTPGWSLKHASTESPHNGVEYWGSGTLDSTGQAVITLPGYFEALTNTDNRNIQLTPIGRATVPMSADRITAGKFTAYGNAGQEFDWLVKAVRKSTNPNEPIDFTVEGPKESTPPPPPPKETQNA